MPGKSKKGGGLKTKKSYMKKKSMKKVYMILNRIKIKEFAK